MTHKNTNNGVHPASQDELLSYPFPFADHSLECPAEYERLRQECLVARVRMPFGGNAVPLTRHADVVKTLPLRNKRTQKTSGQETVYLHQFREGVRYFYEGTIV
jgi:hypothetical protein